MCPIHLFGLNFSFTNSAAYMLGVRWRLYPPSCSSVPEMERSFPIGCRPLAESSYEFTANMLTSSAGKEGMKFFPLVFCIFMFMLWWRTSSASCRIRSP